MSELGLFHSWVAELLPEPDNRLGWPVGKCTVVRDGSGTSSCNKKLFWLNVWQDLCYFLGWSFIGPLESLKSLLRNALIFSCTITAWR